MWWILAALLLAVGETARADPEPPTIETRLAQMQAEIDHLKAAADASALADPGPIKEPLFRVYGFIDMGLQKLWSTDPVDAANTHPTFVLGNVDLYFDFHPADDWSALIETRLTNYPQGTINTTVLDASNGFGDDTVRWSALILERAYIQWQRYEKIGMRVGQFLTPYGIWNVDHGTPTLISLLRPQFITEEMWPTHQLGIEVFGRFDDLLPDRWQVEYHAYVTNGRSPGVIDNNDDKMFGGRVIASTTRPYPMAFGLSAMHGAYNNDASGVINPATTATNPVAYTESGVAGDASIDLGALRLRSELVTRRIRYEPGEHEETSPGSGVFVPDALQMDAYVLAAYRIPGTRFEPYGYVELNHLPTTYGDLQIIDSIGLNTYFTPAIQLKLQYSHATWYRDDTGDASRQKSDIENYLAAKLVMGF